MILAGSLRSNRTYQFMVRMENRQNSSTQSIGYLLVEVIDSNPRLILIGSVHIWRERERCTYCMFRCVISTLCLPNEQFQLINPTSQVALFSVCVGNCSLLENIQWNIYQGFTHPSLLTIQWQLFNQTNQYDNRWFFGRDSSSSSHCLWSV